MKKLLIFAIFSIFIISGCSLKAAIASDRNETKHEFALQLNNGFSKVSPEMKGIPVFEPKATITIPSIAYNSTVVPLTTTDRLVDVSEVQYYIWRTADGPDGAKDFSSTEKENDFRFVFNTKEFSSQRGEYQVEVYGVHEDGAQELLAKSSFTLQQRVPILMYHGIDDYNGNGIKDLFVTPANFEAQMRYLKDNGYTMLTFERWDEVNTVNKPILVTFDDGIKNNLHAFRILQELKDEQFQPAATEYVIANYVDSDDYYLSSEDIKEMSDSGIFSVQSHTLSHADLPIITDFDEELGVSKESLEQLTGKPVIAIAYPYGHFNDKVVNETKKYYQFATTTKHGQFIAKNQPNELLLMDRVRISYSTTLKQFASLIAGN